VDRESKGLQLTVAAASKSNCRFRFDDQHFPGSPTAVLPGSAAGCTSPPPTTSTPARCVSILALHRVQRRLTNVEGRVIREILA
jgi:hypothetical protein